MYSKKRLLCVHAMFTATAIEIWQSLDVLMLPKSRAYKLIYRFAHFTTSPGFHCFRPMVTSHDLCLHQKTLSIDAILIGIDLHNKYEIHQTGITEWAIFKGFHILTNCVDQKWPPLKLLESYGTHWCISRKLYFLSIYMLLQKVLNHSLDSCDCKWHLTSNH